MLFLKTLPYVWSTALLSTSYCRFIGRTLDTVAEDDVDDANDIRDTGADVEDDDDDVTETLVAIGGIEDDDETGVDAAVLTFKQLTGPLVQLARI
jgi:hypothetical protein